MSDRSRNREAGEVEAWPRQDADGKAVPLSTTPVRATTMFHAGEGDMVENLVHVRWDKTLPLNEAILGAGPVRQPELGVQARCNRREPRAAA